VGAVFLAHPAAVNGGCMITSRQLLSRVRSLGPSVLWYCWLTQNAACKKFCFNIFKVCLALWEQSRCILVEEYGSKGLMQENVVMTTEVNNFWSRKTY